MDTTIDEVKIEIESSSASAGSNLDKLAQSISTLQKSLSPATTKLNKFNKTLSNLKNNSSKIKTSGGGLFGGMTKGVAGATIKTTAFIAVMKKVAGVLGNAVTQSNAYVENLNLFRVSMGEATKQATEFVQEFSNALGIDPSNVMRYMGMFNTLAEGFGLSSESAYIMSKNLTQLSYDMSSFLNIPIDQAMQKIKSGFSGEIEPMRAIGIALDQATLQQTAYTLGIDKKISTMTRAQKTELLYYQMMTRTNKMQGDMARTLIAPANALRILKEQFTLLARAIGNMVLPVIMQVLPYVSLLTQALTALANKIANFFGFELPDIDYSSLDGISAGIEDIGDGATATGKKLDKMLNKFDELNVIDFGKESGAGAGDDLLNGGSLGIPLYDYDALENIVETTTEKIKKKLEGFFKKFEGIFKAISKIVNKFKPLFKGLGNALLVVLGGGMIKKIATFITKIKGFSSLSKIISIFSTSIGVAFTEATKFGLSLKGVSTFASSLWGNLKSYTSALSPFTKALGTLASVAGIFTTTYSAIKEMLNGTKDFASTIMNIAGAVGIFGTALSLLVGGPLGIAITAISTLVGGIKAYNDYQKQVAEDKALADLFDGQGQSMEKVLEYYNKLNEDALIYTDSINKSSEAIDENNKKFDETAQELDTLASKMRSSFYSMTDEDFSLIQEKFDSMAVIVTDSNASIADSLIANARHMEELGVMSKEKTDQMIDDVIRLQMARGDKAAEYKRQMHELEIARQRGEVSDEKYYNTLIDLTTKMQGLNDQVSIAETKYNGLVEAYNTNKIDLENPQKAQEFVDNLSSNMNEVITEMTTANDNLMNIYDNVIAQIDDPELKQAFINYKAQAQEAFELDKEKVLGDYKGIFSTMSLQLIESGASTTEEMKGVVDSINQNLEKIGDVDVTGKGKDVLENYTNELIESGTSNTPKIVEFLKENASEIKQSGWLDGLKLTEAEKTLMNSNFLESGKIDFGTLNEIIKALEEDGLYIKNKWGKAIEFDAIEKRAISQSILEPFAVEEQDMKSLLQHIIEQGGTIKDQYGNAIEFTEEEKQWISGELMNPLKSFQVSSDVWEKFREMGRGLPETMMQGITDKAQIMNESATNFINDSVVGPTKQAVEDNKPVIQSTIKSLAEDGVVMSFNAQVPNAKSAIYADTSDVLTGITQAATDEKQSAVDAFGGLGSEMANTFSNNLKVDGTTLKNSLLGTLSNVFTKLKNTNASLFGSLGITLPSIKWFADGGFPETGQFFVARESGPELVGNIGNRAAVANNDQIIAGIAQASYEGVSQALRENSSRDRQPVNVYVGNKKLYSGYGQYANSESNMYGASTIRI